MRSITRCPFRDAILFAIVLLLGTLGGPERGSIDEDDSPPSAASGHLINGVDTTDPVEVPA